MKLLKITILATLLAGCGNKQPLSNRALQVAISLKDERNELIKLTNYLLDGGTDTLAINILRDNYYNKRKVSDSLIKAL